MAVHRLSAGKRNDLVHGDAAAVSVHRPVGALPARGAMVPGARRGDARGVRYPLLDRRSRTSAEGTVDRPVPPRIDVGNARVSRALSAPDQLCVQAGFAAYSVLRLGAEGARHGQPGPRLAAPGTCRRDA
ncbi:conserved hypothetical protein [Ricinus communis]|uniref:Uncharacterized protein n=1 Tax=Ricinus communis TaxID=3988 RepID=B9T9D0_RICCO|nr:conserved hypothetical protein [Ricinus communis]